jgi:hypothetical protein
LLGDGRNEGVVEGFRRPGVDAVGGHTLALDRGRATFHREEAGAEALAALGARYGGVPRWDFTWSLGVVFLPRLLGSSYFGAGTGLEARLVFLPIDFVELFLEVGMALVQTQVDLLVPVAVPVWALQVLAQFVSIKLERLVDPGDDALEVALGR